MKLHNDLVQGSDEWFKIRLGKLTASTAQAIATNGTGLDTLVFEKVAETITGKQKSSYTSSDVERGKEMEMTARNSYEIETGNVVEVVGFVELDKFTGCSPDGFVGEDGLVEIKCKNDANFARFMYDKKVDSEHNWQMQMEMYITGRKWCDYVLFNENFPKTTLITRVERNEADIDKLKQGLESGIIKIKDILKKING